MAIFKVMLTLPAWQDKIINQVIKEEKKENPNSELLERAKNACIKTKDENFMFAFAYFLCSLHRRVEIVKELLDINASKWAIPCKKEIISQAFIQIIDKELCIDALIKAGDCEGLYKFAKEFGHDDKILDYLMVEYEIDLVLDYAKNVKGANINKIGEFIKDYYLSTCDNDDILKKFQKIHQSKIKKSKTLQDSLDLMGESFEK